jgi:3-carboxy-cis,cis-muconate cycloisomerase
MPFTPADSQIFSPLFGDPELAALLSDEESLRRMLQVEGLLARAEGRLGVIPPEAGEAIAAAALSPTAASRIDLEKLRAGVERDGFPVIELVRQLRQWVGEPHGDAVHTGATTQDILDTALVLQLRAALEVIERRLESLISALAHLADRHRHTLMAGRTHSQQAVPVTFGLKAAGWLAPLLRDRDRLRELKLRLLVVQLGGAAGTLAALGERGLEVQQALSAELGLAVPPMPWHTQRDNLAELAGWLSLLTGSLAKMAQDVILLAQSEVGEVQESADADRGGSSAMPQKSNPVTSELIVALARANAAQLAAMHQAMIQEHERGTHGWQLEWLTLPQMLGSTAAAVRHAGWLAENLQVDEARMAANVRASHGVLLAEALSDALAPSLGRGEAKALVSQAAREAIARGENLVDVVKAKSSADLDWEVLRREDRYLGSVDVWIDRVINP